MKRMLIIALLGLFSIIINIDNVKAWGPVISADTITHCGWVQVKRPVNMNSMRNIAILHKKLEDLGYDVTIDGAAAVYGYQTQAAIHQFQIDYHLNDQSGVLNLETITHLAYQAAPFPNIRKCKANYYMR